MTGVQAKERLAELAESEFKKLEALAQQICTESRGPANKLAELWRAGGESDKAQPTLTAMGELAVRPWLAASKAGGKQNRLQAMTQGCKAYLAAQQQFMRRLKQMMQSKTAVPLAAPRGPVEEPELPRRECDQAYLWGRQLLKADDGELDCAVIEDEFLRLTEKQRDSEIANYNKTGQWASLAELPIGKG